jgi:hypothetical protein
MVKKSAALPSKPKAKVMVSEEQAAAFVRGGNISSEVPQSTRQVGRPKTGKRSNPDYARLTAWVPVAVLHQLKVKCLEHGCDLGDLIMEYMNFEELGIDT